ncbi:MAG TPA: hypothetical protein VMW50_13880 [Dehalococcoidia bacterium]|nr:hypothetical protein [Dehalococcoidia bacterium]
MKGFRSLVTFQGYSLGEGFLHYSLRGRKVGSFSLGVGGDKDAVEKGVVIRCHGWGINAERVVKAVCEDGLAVVVSGYLSQYVKALVNDEREVRINNDLYIVGLSVQLKPSDEVLTEVSMNDWTDRNDAIKKARAEGLKLKDISEEFGISVERVRQILLGRDYTRWSAKGKE